MATGNNSIITLKLLVDVRSQKVLFAEAEKDFVDFMFCLLTLPLGSVIQLITPSLMVGSIGKLYQSVDKLYEMYLVANKAALLRPAMSSFHGVRLPLLLPSAATTTGVKYYACRSCYKKVTTTCNIYCPSCGVTMNCILDVVVPSMPAPVSVSSGNQGGSEGGFVKGVVTCMITDDLEITLSAISST